MSSVSALVSVEEYLNRSGKPSCEYLEGALYPKPMPTKLHALVQFLLVTLLREQNVEALAEVTVRVAEKKFLIPDVIAATHIEDPYPTQPVLLCIEIVSPEDRLSAVFAKCEAYHVWGVLFCWVIDPLKQTAWEYHAGHDPAPVHLGGILRAGELTAPLTALFTSTGQIS